MRAHANCVENLPVYAAVVVVINAAGIASPFIDLLARVFSAARVAQTSIHVLLEETPAAVGVRFGFFAVQLVCMIWMWIHAAVAAA